MNNLTKSIKPNTSWSNMEFTTEKLKEVILNQIGNKKILAIYIKGSHAKGLSMPERTLESGEIRTASDYDITIIVFPDFDGIASMRLLGELKNVKGDYIVKPWNKLMNELVYKQNYDAVEALFYPKECYLYIHPLYQKLIDMREKFFTLDFCRSAVGNAKSQYETFTCNTRLMNTSTEEVEEFPNFEDYVSIITKGFANPLTLNQYLEHNGIQLKYLKHYPLNHNVDSYADILKSINYTLAKHNQQFSDIKKSCPELTFDWDNTGLKLLDENKFLSDIDCVDTISILYYDFYRDESFKDDDESYGRFLSVTNSVNSEKAIDDYLTLINKPNIEKDKFGLYSNSTSNNVTVCIPKGRCAADLPEQYYPLGIALFKNHSYREKVNKYIAVHKWDGTLKDRTGWSEKNDKERELRQLRNEDRHSINLSAAKLAGVTADSLYDTKAFQQGYFINHITIEFLENLINTGVTNLQIDRTQIDREFLLSLKLQDEFNNYISKSAATEMIKNQESRLIELIKEASSKNLLSSKIEESVANDVLNISKLIFKHSVFLDFDLEFDDGIIDNNYFVEVINKYIV